MPGLHTIGKSFRDNSSNIPKISSNRLRNKHASGRKTINPCSICVQVHHKNQFNINFLETLFKTKPNVS